MDTKNMREGFKSKLSAPIIMLVAALVIAGIASVLIYGMLQKKASVKTAATDTRTIAVAAFDVKWGTVLTNEFVKTQPYLDTSLPAGYIADPRAAVGRVVRYPIQAGEPITESRLAPVDVKSGGLAAVVAPNKRAMGVKVDKVVGVSGFIHPGNRVDVLVSLPKSDNVSASITKIVLENIPVLAVGEAVEQAAGAKEKAIPVDVITLEVTPEDGEKLALAAVEGKLQLALRNYGDSEDVKTRGTTVAQLLTSYSGGVIPTSVEATKRKSAPAKRTIRVKQGDLTPGKIYTVEVIKGTKSTQEKFTTEGE
jgi:pilus assembly protein CpaB